MVEPRAVQPLRLWRDHAPGGQVVQRRAPQDGLLAARVHGHVAAHAGGFGRGRVDREHVAAALGRIADFVGSIYDRIYQTVRWNLNSDFLATPVTMLVMLALGGAAFFAIVISIQWMIA